MKVTVIGTGGWGTALAVLLHGNGHAVTLWGRLAEEVDPILADRENKAFLPGVKIPETILVTLDPAVAGRKVATGMSLLLQKLLQLELCDFASRGVR